MPAEKIDLPVADNYAVFRACRSAYVLIGGFWFVLFLWSLYLAFHSSFSQWQASIATGVVLLFLLVWLRTFEIRILDGVFCYRSLFGGTRVLKLEEIESAEIRIDLKSRVGPVYKLILWPLPTTSSKQIVVNMKVFGKEDLHRVFDILGPKLKTKRRFSIFRSE